MGKLSLDTSFSQGKCSMIMIKRYSIIQMFNSNLLKAKEELDSIPIAGISSGYVQQDCMWNEAKLLIIFGTEFDILSY